MNTQENRRSGTNKLRLENDIEEYHNNRMNETSQIYFLGDEETLTGCTYSLVRIVIKSQIQAKHVSFMAHFPKYYPFYAPKLFLESTNLSLKLPIDSQTKLVELKILGDNWSPVFTLD